MESRELELRNTTYGLLRELGRAPTAAEVATRLGLAVDDVLEAGAGSTPSTRSCSTAPSQRCGCCIRCATRSSGADRLPRCGPADRRGRRTRTAPGTRSALRGASPSTGGSRRDAPTATTPLEIEVRGGRPDDDDPRLPRTASPRQRGGTTSSSPEARCSTLPVGRARRALARGTDARCDDPGRRRSPASRVAWWHDRLSPAWRRSTARESTDASQRVEVDDAFCGCPDVPSRGRKRSSRRIRASEVGSVGPPVSVDGPLATLRSRRAYGDGSALRRTRARRRFAGHGWRASGGVR